MVKPEQQKLFAVIGNPVKHSLSPAMMNAAFKSLDFPAAYLAFCSDDLAEDLDLLHRTGFGGLSVTIPHKETAYRLAVAVDDTAQAIGAVNTLRREKDGWQGCNTDWIGANRALAGATSLEGKRALVLGAGGAARAVVFGLKKAGSLVTVCNRSVERGEALARTFETGFIPLSRLNDAPGDFEVIVQCTSVGLDGSGSSKIVPDDFFEPGMVVMDTVYRPFWTPFTIAAKKAGCAIVSGLDMLLHQGVAQLEWWLGLPVPEPTVEVMRDALKVQAVAGGRND